MDQEAHAVPFDMEAPIPWLFWEPLELILSFVLFGFGIVANLWMVGCLAGAGVLIGSRYLKRGAKHGAMQHFIWAHGLQVDAPLSKKFKPAWLNDFIE